MPRANRNRCFDKSMRKNKLDFQSVAWFILCGTVERAGGFVSGILALLYFLMMVPPVGATGPAFATTHSMLAARDDCSPVSRMLRTVNQAGWFTGITRATGSKSTCVVDINDASCRNDPAESAGSSVQYAV